MSICLGDRIRVTPQEFASMPTATQPDNLPAPPYMACKVLIDGRWHACERQYSCGCCIHYVNPIVIVVRADVRRDGAAP